MSKDYGMYGKKGPASRFTWDEVRCTDGTLPWSPFMRRRFVQDAHDLNRLRIAIAIKFQVPRKDVWINVNSWYRSKRYNRSIGGATWSQHPQGRAMDITVHLRRKKDRKVIKLKPAYVAKLAAANVPRFANGGIGVYRTFTHVDNRKGKARWDARLAA